MKKRNLVILSIVFLGLIALAFFFLLKGEKEHIPGEEVTPFPCLVYQNVDPGKPCYSQSGSVGSEPTSPSLPTAPDGEGETPVVTPSVLSSCYESGNVIERNDCIMKKADAAEDPALCSNIESAYTRAACVRGVADEPLVGSSPSRGYQDFVRTVFTRPTSTVVYQTGTVEVPPLDLGSDPRLTEDAFMKRLTTDGPLHLFGISRYQVRPGETVKLYGSGFNGTESIQVGGYSVTATPIDAFTVSFIAPQTLGQFEVNVTNSKGASQGNDHPIQLTVSDNPAMIPVITSISPAVPRYTDTVTVSGSGFSSSNTVSTTLGPLMSVSGSGGSLQFKISDFPVVALIKDLPEVKGKLIPVSLIVQSEGGFNEEPFTFNVQF